MYETIEVYRSSPEFSFIAWIGGATKHNLNI